MPKLKLPARYEPSPTGLNPGGMSDAQICRDVHLDRLVVVKSLAPGIDAGRILDELSALQEIRSKHVVQIYDALRDERGNVAAIVEEYPSGDDLSASPPPTTAEEFIRLIYPIAEGIADIHDHNRVHRDIKPANILINLSGEAKIADFGISAFVDSTLAVARPGPLSYPGICLHGQAVLAGS